MADVTTLDRVDVLTIENMALRVTLAQAALQQVAQLRDQVIADISRKYGINLNDYSLDLQTGVLTPKLTPVS